MKTMLDDWNELWWNLESKFCILAKKKRKEFKKLYQNILEEVRLLK